MDFDFDCEDTPDDEFIYDSVRTSHYRRVAPMPSFAEIDAAFAAYEYVPIIVTEVERPVLVARPDFLFEEVDCRDAESIHILSDFGFDFLSCDPRAIERPVFPIGPPNVLANLISHEHDAFYMGSKIGSVLSIPSSIDPLPMKTVRNMTITENGFVHRATGTAAHELLGVAQVPDFQVKHIVEVDFPERSSIGLSICDTVVELTHDKPCLLLETSSESFFLVGSVPINTPVKSLDWVEGPLGVDSDLIANVDGMFYHVPRVRVVPLICREKEGLWACTRSGSIVYPCIDGVPDVVYDYDIDKHLKLCESGTRILPATNEHLIVMRGAATVADLAFVAKGSSRMIYPRFRATRCEQVQRSIHRTCHKYSLRSQVARITSIEPEINRAYRNLMHDDYATVLSRYIQHSPSKHVETRNHLVMTRLGGITASLDNYEMLVISSSPGTSKFGVHLCHPGLPEFYFWVGVCSIVEACWLYSGLNCRIMARRMYSKPSMIHVMGVRFVFDVAEMQEPPWRERALV